MKKNEIEATIEFHRKQMELNAGKAKAAKQRCEFHRATMLYLSGLLAKGKEV